LKVSGSFFGRVFHHEGHGGTRSKRIMNNEQINVEWRNFFEWQVLAEYDGAGELQHYFIYGNYIDEPLVMSDGADDYYYVQDHLYSTVALIGYVDSAWVVVERYEYDAYGKMTRLDPDFRKSVLLHRAKIRRLRPRWSVRTAITDNVLPPQNLRHLHCKIPPAGPKGN